MQSPFLDKDIVAELLTESRKKCGNACNGSGYHVTEGAIVDCECIVEFKRLTRIAGANIPKKHRDFSFSMLSEKFCSENERMLQVLEAYSSKLPRMVENGVGLYIQGQVGLAKSALSYTILQTAVMLGITAYATRMSKITTLTFSAFSDPVAKEQLQWILNDVQLLFIDEIEKDFKVGNAQEFSGSRVNEFFSEVYDSKKSIIITSNMSKADLRKVHADNVVDRFQELADIVLVGESFRRPNTAIQEILS